MKKRLLLMLVFAALIFVMPVNTHARKIRKKTAPVYITVGKEKVLKIKGYNKKVHWKSKNKSVICVLKSGRIKALKAGSTNVYTRIKGRTYSYKVVSMQISKTSLFIKNGLSKKISVRNGGSKVKWRSSNNKVAKVKNGRITAYGPGTAVITAIAHKRIYKCTVTVPAVTFSNLSFVLPVVNEKASSMGDDPDGKVYTRYFTDTPRYSSTNSSVAKVDSKGNIRVVGKGTSFIKVRANGLVYSSLITVSQKPVDIFLDGMAKYNLLVKKYGSYFVRHETPVETYEEAMRLIRHGKKVRINCRAVACWVFHDMGIDPYTIYAKRGSFVDRYRGNMTNYLTRIKKGPGIGMTCKQAIDRGLLQPGDICCFKGITHTFTYSGKGYMFYDGGLLTQRAGYKRIGLRMDYSKVSYYANKPISEILRWKE